MWHCKQDIRLHRTNLGSNYYSHQPTIPHTYTMQTIPVADIAPYHGVAHNRGSVGLAVSVYTVIAVLKKSKVLEAAKKRESN